MIWTSIWAMTVIDAAIIAMVGYALTVVMGQRRQLARGPARFGSMALGAGLSIIGLFYLFDLLAMHLLPVFVGDIRAMGLMKTLHLNISWFGGLFGLGAISIGLVMVARAILTLISDLAGREQQLADAQRIGRIG